MEVRPKLWKSIKTRYYISEFHTLYPNYFRFFAKFGNMLLDKFNRRDKMFNVDYVWTHNFRLARHKNALYPKFLTLRIISHSTLYKKTLLEFFENKRPTLSGIRLTSFSFPSLRTNHEAIKLPNGKFSLKLINKPGPAQVGAISKAQK